MATPGALVESAAVKSRPALMEVPIVSKYPVLAACSAASVGVFPPGGVTGAEPRMPSRLPGNPVVAATRRTPGSGYPRHDLVEGARAPLGRQVGIIGERQTDVEGLQAVRLVPAVAF